MASKILLFEAQRVGDDILKSVKARSKNFTTRRFDVRIFGPDDVRFEKALKVDKSLASDLKGACSKAYQRYVAEMGEFLADLAAKQEKLKGDERKTFDNRFSGALITAGDAALKKLETSVAAETKKRWKETVADNSKELSGVRFEPIVIDFLPDFELVADTAAEKEEDEADVPREKWGKELVLAQQALNGAARSLKGPIENTAKMPELIQLIQQTVARVKDAYEKAPRESRLDDPKTEDQEELDEGELNTTLFNRYGKEIAAAEGAAIDVLAILLGKKEGVDPQCGAAVKELNDALKRLAPVAQGRKSERQAAEALEKSLDGITEAVKKLLAMQSEARVGARSAQESWMVLKTIREKKGEALDLIDRAALDLKPLKDRLVAVVQLIEKCRVSSGLGT